MYLNYHTMVTDWRTIVKREKLSFVQPLSPFAPEMIIKAF